jgi:hypothetical protein
LFNMHVSKADAPPKEAHWSPVRGSAHQSLRNTEQWTAHPGTHNPQSLTEAEEKLAFSNFVLSDVSAPFSRLPVSKSVPTPPQPRNRRGSSGRRPSNDGLRPNQHSIIPGSTPRRDSILRSSDDSANDDDSLRSFSNLQSSDCDSNGVNLHPTKIVRPIGSYCNSPSSSITCINPHQIEVQLLEEDKGAGAEATRWESNEVCFEWSIHTRLCLTRIP